MVQRRERLKKQLLKTQLELLELQGEEILEAASNSSSSNRIDMMEERKESDNDGEEEICSPPSVRQTRYVFTCKLLKEEEFCLKLINWKHGIDIYVKYQSLIKGSC